MTPKTTIAMPDRESKTKEQERKTPPVLANDPKSPTNTTNKSERDWERQMFLLWPGD